MARGRWIGSLRRNLLRLASYLAAVPLAYLLASLVGAALPNGADWPQAPREVRVGFLRGPIHYDLLLPIDPAIRRDFQFAESGRGLPLSHPAAEWLMLGWGSEAVYPTAGRLRDVPIGAMWTAATGDRAVMRLDVTTALPDANPGLVWVWITRAQFEALQRAVAEGFLRDQTYRPLPHPAPGLTATDSFWRGAGEFSLWRPCNQWLAEVLTAAGIPFGRWTPTTQAFDLALWRHLPDPAP